MTKICKPASQRVFFSSFYAPAVRRFFLRVAERAETFFFFFSFILHQALCFLPCFPTEFLLIFSNFLFFFPSFSVIFLIFSGVFDSLRFLIVFFCYYVFFSVSFSIFSELFLCFFCFVFFWLFSFCLDFLNFPSDCFFVAPDRKCSDAV